MKTLVLLFISISLYATNINDIINIAHEKNPTIKKIQEQILSSNYDIKNSNLYKNPILSFGLNDINLDNPEKRDIEAMQTNYISISQEIIGSDKLKLNTKIATYNKNITKLYLQEQKNLITKQIYNLYYIKEQLKQQIKLNKQKLSNIKNIQNYHTNHIQHKRAFQQSLQNDLSIEKLNLQIISLEEQIKQTYTKISEIVNKKIQNITTTNNNLNYKNQDNINNHTLLKIQNLLIEQTNTKSQLAKENKIPNYTLSGGYYQRDARDDYINIAIKIPLNIYSKEKNNLEKSYKQINIAKNQYEELKNKLIKNYQIELSKNTIAKKSIKFINKIINHIKKEKELISSQNNTDSILEVLNIDNKLLDNQILLSKYKKDLYISQLNLSYLTSNLIKE